MRISSIIFLCTLLLLAGRVFARQSMSLEQCLQTGLDNNPSLQAAKFKLDAAGSDIMVARADFFPALTSSYSSNRINSISAQGPTQTDYIDQNIHVFNTKLTQILYAGSRLVNTYEKAKILEQATRSEMELTKLELIYNIETTFYKVMQARQDVIVAAEAVDRLTQSVKAAEAFAKKELVPYVDVLKAKVDLADADNQLSIARNNENRQRTALFSLMNLPFDPAIEFTEEPPAEIAEKPTYDLCLAYAAEHRPDLHSLEHQLQAARKQSEIALGKYLPVVRAEVGYYDHNNDYIDPGVLSSGTFDRDQVNTYWQAGVTVSWDLFDGGKAWYENEKYSLEAQKIGALLNDARNTIATGIRKALYSLAEAEQRLASSSGALSAARENYTAEDNRLKAGISSITELLDAQSRLIRAQVNQSNATLAFQLARSELKFMTGGKKI